MDKDAAARVAVEIADALGEHGSPGQAPRARVERQIARMAALMGETWVRAALRTATEASEDRGVNETILLRRDKNQRSIGGVFFSVARTVAFPSVDAGTIDRRDFFSTFCWRLPAEKPPRPPREKPKPLPRPRRERLPPVPVGRGRRAPLVEPEVYTTIRRPR